MIIFLYGQDTYRSLQHLQKLQARFKKEIDPTGSSITSLEGSDLDLAHIRQVVLAPSLFVKNRFVIFKNILSNKPSKDLQASLIELLGEYANDEQSNILVFWEALSKKELNIERLQKSLLDFLLSQQFVQEFESLSLIQLRNWVIKKCAAQKTNIDREALKNLLNITGADMWRLALETDKLIAYRLGKTIHVEDVDLQVAGDLEEDLYALLDLVMAGNIRDALDYLAKLQLSPDKRLGVFHTLRWQLNAVAGIKRCLNQNITTETEIAKLTNIHPYVVKKNKIYAQKISSTVLSKLLNRVTELEIDMRRNPKLENLFLTRFVFGLTAISKNKN